MLKLIAGKETVKFLPCFKVYPAKRFWRRVRPVRLVLPARPVQPSQAQSNPVQPNPATPPPPGKEIGKETVKFLALFDPEPIMHHSIRRSADIPIGINQAPQIVLLSA